MYTSNVPVHDLSAVGPNYLSLTVGGVDCERFTNTRVDSTYAIGTYVSSPTGKRRHRFMARIDDIERPKSVVEFLTMVEELVVDRPTLSSRLLLHCLL